jgi:hypothetical protein
MPDYAALDRAGEKPLGCFAGLRTGIRNVLAEGLILLAFVLTSTLLVR